MSDKERDELAELIANAEYPNMDPPWAERKDRSPVKWYSRKYADAVIADGWTKPRTIATVEELTALAVGSIIMMTGVRSPFLLTSDGWESSRFPGKPVWDYTNANYLPATVLHEPVA